MSRLSSSTPAAFSSFLFFSSSSPSIYSHAIEANLSCDSEFCSPPSADRGGAVGQNRIRSSPRGGTPVATVPSGDEPSGACRRKHRRAWDLGTPPIHVLWSRRRPGDGTAHGLGPPCRSTRGVRSLLRGPSYGVPVRTRIPSVSLGRAPARREPAPLGNKQPDDSVVLVEQENLAVRSWSETQVGAGGGRSPLIRVLFLNDLK